MAGRFNPFGGRRPKYGNRKVTDPASGRTFDSKREYTRWLQLSLLQKAGAISELEHHPPAIELVVNGVLVCKYEPDFVYRERGERVIEDTKGVRTKEYVLKRKLLFAVHGITIRET